MNSIDKDIIKIDMMVNEIMATNCFKDEMIGKIKNILDMDETDDVITELQTILDTCKTDLYNSEIENLNNRILIKQDILTRMECAEKYTLNESNNPHTTLLEIDNLIKKCGKKNGGKRKSRKYKKKMHTKKRKSHKKRSSMRKRM